MRTTIIAIVSTLQRRGEISRKKLLMTLWDKHGLLSFDVNPAMRALILSRIIVVNGDNYKLSDDYLVRLRSVQDYTR